MNLKKYQTIVFDCDGVILDSNKVKTTAFYEAALPYGNEAAERLVKHHVENGGISRYEKFEWFLLHVVKKPSDSALDELLNSYAEKVRAGLLSCDIANGLAKLRSLTAHCNWLIVSGGDQIELRDIFQKRELSQFFNGGIFGSPDNKIDILKREMNNGNISKNALFIGDSRYDHISAKSADIDFLFVNYWTEFQGWQSYCQSNNINVADSLEVFF